MDNKLILEELRYSFPLKEESLRHFDRFGEVLLDHSNLNYILLGTGSNVCSFTVPRGYKGVVKKVGMSVEQSSVFNDAKWKLTVNDAPVVDLSDFESQFVNQGYYFRHLTTDGIIFLDNHSYQYPLKENDVVSLYVKRLGTNATDTAGYGRIYGWYWVV